MSRLGFISDLDFKNHVRQTIHSYGKGLLSYDLAKFNSNIVDPIKLIFDKVVYRYSWEDIIKNEIYRQRDKSNNNHIGYFHQRIFQYIQNCTVPDANWDVIFKRDDGITLPDGDKVKTIFVEMKNKHNTMNSASSSKTYTKMQNQLLSDDECSCFLVEAIAKQSQNITWSLTVDGKHNSHRRIRRVSMDEFYSIVTGQPDAFYQMCVILPLVIEEIITKSNAETDSISVPQDVVFDELQEISKKDGLSLELALYMLGFNSYKGFSRD